MKAAWVVVNTIGDGYSQKYSPPTKVFKRKADAIKYLRGKIKRMIELEKETIARNRWQSYPTYDSVADFIRRNDDFPWRFSTNEGDWWLDRIEVID